MELRGLNDKQSAAVKATEGRVRIIAGAGVISNFVPQISEK